MSAKTKKKKTAAKRPAKKKAAPKRAAKKVARAAAKTPAKRVAKKPARKPAKKARAKVAKKKVAAKARPKTAVRRRDHAGHLDPKYAADLRARSRETSTREEGGGFLDAPRTDDDLAEALAEEVVGKATSGEDNAEDVANQDVPEELGGPFVLTPAGAEFAEGTDESNPKGSRREPFPTT